MVDCFRAEMIYDYRTITFGHFVAVLVSLSRCCTISRAINGGKLIFFFLFFVARFVFHHRLTTCSQPATTTSWCLPTSKVTWRCRCHQWSSLSTQTKSSQDAGIPQISPSYQHRRTKPRGCGRCRLSKINAIFKLFFEQEISKTFSLFFYGKLDQKKLVFVTEQFFFFCIIKKISPNGGNFNTEDSKLIYHLYQDRQKNLCYFYRQTKIKKKLS